MKIPERWTFESDEVADDFDSHVREQLPWYDLVTDAIVQIGRHYIPEDGLVYDIGASRGNVTQALKSVVNERGANVVSIESSVEMVRRWQGPGQICQARAEEFSYEAFDFGVAMLALMFLRPADVPTLLDRLVAKMNPGGALVIVERTLPPAGYMSIVSSRLTLAAKAAAGAPSDQIVAKELSLAGVQRPLDPHLLESRGAVEWFRFGDFAGYVLEAGQ